MNIATEYDTRSITPRRYNKPHIVFRNGYWRVNSPTINMRRWQKAYEVVAEENLKLYWEYKRNAHQR